MSDALAVGDGMENSLLADNQYNAWLASTQAIRVLLIEVTVYSAGLDITRYLSNKPYVTNSADSPANIAYLPIVAGGIAFTEQLSLSGEGGLSFGDIELHNLAGERDSWLGDVWVNRPITIYLGDPRWPRSDFRLIFNGIVADIDSKSRETINLKLRDKLQRLNTPVSEQKLGGTTPNQEALLPLLLGECHNVTPLLVDPATLTYQVHSSAMEGVIEVRDNGVPVAWQGGSDGTFSLQAEPAGTITVSAQGDKANGSYANTVAALVQRLVTGYGKAGDSFTQIDLDLANLADFDARHPQAVGIYLANRENVLTVCQQLAASVGAQMLMSRKGTLRLIQLALPGFGTPLVITPMQMLQNSLHIRERTEVVASVKVAYCKNWTVQTGLLTDIPTAHKDLYAKEWLTANVSDSAVQALYRLNIEPVQQEGLLLTTQDAQAEAARQLALWRVPRTVYQFTGTAALLGLELGQAVTLQHPRYGLAAGGAGMVVSLVPDWMRGQIEVGVLV